MSRNRLLTFRKRNLTKIQDVLGSERCSGCCRTLVFVRQTVAASQMPAKGSLIACLQLNLVAFGRAQGLGPSSATATAPSCYSVRATAVLINQITSILH